MRRLGIHLGGPRRPALDISFLKDGFNQFRSIAQNATGILTENGDRFIPEGPTIGDGAKAAGLGTATVGRVLGVLRSEFSGLAVDERINSNDELEFSYRNVRDYIADHGPPIGVHNVAGGNRGIANALRDEGLLGQVVFIGHEMTRNTHILLASGAMDFAIGHDLDREVALSVEVIQRFRETGTAESNQLTPVRAFTRFNCLSFCRSASSRSPQTAKTAVARCHLGDDELREAD